MSQPRITEILEELLTEIAEIKDLLAQIATNTEA